MKKINCGGFYINEDNFEITDDGELKLKSGGGGNIVVCPMTSEFDLGEEMYVYTAQMAAGELYAAESVVFEISQDAEQMKPGMKFPCLKAASLSGQYRFGFANPNTNDLTVVYITANSPLDYPTNADGEG